MWYDPDDREDDEDLTEEQILDDIMRQINYYWSRKRWCLHVRDVESERKYIQAMRAKYVFPDYLSLVGEPSEDDFDERSWLRVKRQAELLLIGAFTWQGHTIARHPAVYRASDRYGDSHWLPRMRQANHT